eukprot:11548066-Ditylum_brightwellii.AAC.1
MQIRTGEGKSMILGAAAVVLALLGFKARCVCYSEYLSERDFGLFRDVFDDFAVREHVKYSKITTLSEDKTKAKGDIRMLTENLLRNKLEEVTSASMIMTSESIDAHSTGAIVVVGPTTGVNAVDGANGLGDASETGNNVNGAIISTNACFSADALSFNRKEILLVDEVD